MLNNLVKKLVGIGTTKMVFIVRTDLKMGQGKVAAQCSQAAVSLYQSALKSPETPLKAWLLSGQPKIVLKSGVNSEETLKRLHEEAKSLKLNSCLVYDAGRTQLQSGTLTVLGIGPAKTEDVDKITNNLKLL